MTVPETNPERSGVLDYLSSALAHAMSALRYYAALLAADGEARLNRTLRTTVWALALVAFGVVGLVLLAGGVADLLDAAMGPRVPGLGRVIVGGAIVAAFIVLAMLQHPKEPVE